MSKYKLHISIDDENFFWIIFENKKIINRNAAREELDKITKVYYYNKTNICHMCKESNNITDSSILYPGNALHEKDKNNNLTKEYICKNCYYKNERKNNPYCLDNIKKSLRDRRTGNLDPNSPCGKGDRFEKLTSMWRGVGNMNEINDNYESPIDHSRDPELGILQTKGAFYSTTYRYWHQDFRNLHNSIIRGCEFHNVIFYCASSDEKTIERIYIFPRKEIENISSISIIKDPTDGHGNHITPLYEKYRIRDKETIKKVNNVWKKINKI